MTNKKKNKYIPAAGAAGLFITGQGAATGATLPDFISEAKGEVASEKFTRDVKNLKKHLGTKAKIHKDLLPGTGPAYVPKSYAWKAGAPEAAGAHVGRKSLGFAAHELGHEKIDRVLKKRMGKGFKAFRAIQTPARKYMLPVAALGAVGTLTVPEKDKHKKLLGYGTSAALSPIVASELAATGVGTKAIAKTKGLKAALKSLPKPLAGAASYAGLIGAPALAAYLSTRKSKTEKKASLMYSNEQVKKAFEKVSSWGGVAKATGRTLKQFGQGKTTLPQFGKQVRGVGKSIKAHAKKDVNKLKKSWEEL